LEPTGKKTKFLTLVIKELNLGPVELVNKRAEDYAKEKREHFDIVTARAVADLPILCELCLPLVKVSGEFWAMKGPDITLELQKSQTAIKLLGGQLKEINQYTYDNQRRNNIGISKVKPSPAKYPRSYGLIRKQPLWWLTIIEAKVILLIYCELIYEQKRQGNTRV